ncbi:MAG: substrate-binding domain-containing protein [Verrucomicrobiales bacterium]|nr:substrate-binding domain-containing protein [Verrucomicrobiales bacterium]
MTKNPATLRIGIALQSGPSYAVEIFQGIVDFSRKVGNWQLEVDSDFHFGPRPVSLDASWKGDGIIPLSGENRILDAAWLKKSGIPVVNATGWFDEYPGAPIIFWDDTQIARLAAEHLVSLGLNRFAYFGPQRFEPAHRRARSFRQLLEQAGKSCQLFEWTEQHMPDVVVRNRNDWRSAIDFIKQSLQQVELPAGILANTDVTGSLVTQAVEEMGLRCPDEIAIMSIWNDKMVCESSHPPLTSIEIDYHQFGYDAATILHRMISEPSYQPPDITRSGGRKLVRRESTDYLSFDDPLIATALRHIRHHGQHRPMSVNEVIDLIPMSRSSFTSRFKNAVGHSAKSEITRVRLDQVKKLLQQSDWTITRIAEECGFDSSQDLSRLFRKQLGQTPTECRQG